MTYLELQKDIEHAEAVWGDGKKYRYVLYREWDTRLPKAVFIGLNPSVANENFDDRTVRKCINYARREKCGSLSMLNAFALVSTDSKKLGEDKDPVGPENDFWIKKEISNAELIVVAWGSNGNRLDRGHEIIALLGKQLIRCFGLNQDGSPTHPLYLPKDKPLEDFVEVCFH